MYIDTKKFAYPTPLSADDQAAHARDKRYAASAYESWFKENLPAIIERLWEVDDIGVVERIGAFVKLLKEAEFTYSLGIYKSAIALIGVSAEDLCRFFANLSGHNLDHLSQFARINQLEQLGLLTPGNAGLFHNIRVIRNDCLHFNLSFQSKTNDDLRADALAVINDLKRVYADIIGATAFDQVDGSKLIDIINLIAQEASEGAHDGVLNLDDAASRIRNVLSEVTGIDISMNLGGEPVVRWSHFLIEDVDLDRDSPEITLRDRLTGFVVIVDIGSEQLEAFEALQLSEGQTVLAALRSVTNGLGITAEWRFVALPSVIAG